MPLTPWPCLSSFCVYEFDCSKDLTWVISYSIYLLWLAKKVSIMSSEFIHVIACVRNSFLFTAELWSIPCIDHILLIHSFISGYKLLPHRFVFFLNILFWCTLNWMKGLLSKLSRASLLFTRIPDFLSLCSPEFLFPAWLLLLICLCLPLFSWEHSHDLRRGLLIFEGWAHYSFITFWIHREIKELWSLLIPGLNYLYLFLQKPEDRLRHDPGSRAGLPKMLVPWPHSRHFLGTSALTTPSNLSRVIVVLPSD